MPYFADTWRENVCVLQWFFTTTAKHTHSLLIVWIVIVIEFTSVQSHDISNRFFAGSPRLLDRLRKPHIMALLRNWNYIFDFISVLFIVYNISPVRSQWVRVHREERGKKRFHELLGRYFSLICHKVQYISTNRFDCGWFRNEQRKKRSQNTSKNGKGNNESRRKNER